MIAQGETVLLLHGLGRTRWSFHRLQRVLERDGYRVVNQTYPSRTQPVEALAQRWLAPLVAVHAAAPRLHFVTHSMGGIVLRCFLRDHAVPNIGRVVMLAPPNHGSDLADRLRQTWFYRTFNGPAGQQLGTDGLPVALGPWPAHGGELGIIAGSGACTATGAGARSTGSRPRADGRAAGARRALAAAVRARQRHGAQHWFCAARRDRRL